jgi:hypothetical protein
MEMKLEFNLRMPVSLGDTDLKSMQKECFRERMTREEEL